MRVFTYSLLTLMLVASANAQTPADPAIEACRTTGRKCNKRGDQRHPHKQLKNE